MSESKIYKKLCEILISHEYRLLLPELINIIYQYVKGNYIETYNDTIHCYKNGMWMIPEKLTIIGNQLFVTDYVQRIYIFDINTHKLIQTMDLSFNDKGASNHTISDYVEKYLTDNKIDNDSQSSTLNFSGYYSRNIKMIKNFWYINYRKNKEQIIASATDLIFVYIPRIDKIFIFDKQTNKRIGHIKEIYKYKKPLLRFYKNIFVYDNVLYIVGCVVYSNIEGEVYSNMKNETEENYFHLYNATTFEFIREFGKNQQTSLLTFSPKLGDEHLSIFGKGQNKTLGGNPDYMAFTHDKIFISMRNQTIEVWNREECL
jgi:hypothetical protein